MRAYYIVSRPFLLPNCPFSVPTFEENLLRICIKQAHNSKVCHNLENVVRSKSFNHKYLSPRNIQFLKTRTISANFVEEHIIRNISLQGQLREARAVHYHRIEGRAEKRDRCQSHTLIKKREGNLNL